MSPYFVQIIKYLEVIENMEEDCSAFFASVKICLNLFGSNLKPHDILEQDLRDYWILTLSFRAEEKLKIDRSCFVSGILLRWSLDADTNTNIHGGFWKWRKRQIQIDDSNKQQQMALYSISPTRFTLKRRFLTQGLWNIFDLCIIIWHVWLSFRKNLA